MNNVTRFIRENFSFLFWTIGGAIGFSLVVQNGFLLSLAFVISRIIEFALRTYLETRQNWSPVRAGFFALLTWTVVFLTLGFILSQTGLVDLAPPVGR